MDGSVHMKPFSYMKILPSPYIIHSKVFKFYFLKDGKKYEEFLTPKIFNILTKINTSELVWEYISSWLSVLPKVPLKI